MSEWKEVSRAEAIAALDAGTHDVERENVSEQDNIAVWLPVQTNEKFFPHGRKYRIRRKQEYRDVRLPLGVKEEPKRGDQFFVLSEYVPKGYMQVPWLGNTDQLRALSRRAIYTDESIAQEAVRAMGWATE
jgi:hypothetical protein